MPEYTPLNKISLVVVSRRSYGFDGHVAFSVNDRETGRLIGHVGHTENKRYGRRNGTWCYLGARQPRGVWTLAGWRRDEAVDRLMSADDPSGMFTAGIHATFAGGMAP